LKERRRRQQWLIFEVKDTSRHLCFKEAVKTGFWCAYLQFFLLELNDTLLNPAGLLKSLLDSSRLFWKQFHPPPEGDIQPTGYNLNHHN